MTPHAAGYVIVGILALFYAGFGDGWPPRRAAIAFMIGSWGARRAIVLLYTRSSTDGPPLSVRPFAWRALAAALLSSPALVVSMNAAEGFSVLELGAAMAWIAGFTGEAASDHHRIRRYAFEGLVWLAYAFFAAPSVAQLVL